MKAAFIEHFGGPEVLKYGDLPDPVAAAGEVVVDVVAASVNGADWKVRSGQYSQAMFPLVLGRDFSGLVAAVSWSRCNQAANDRIYWQRKSFDACRTTPASRAHAHVATCRRIPDRSRRECATGP